MQFLNGGFNAFVFFNDVLLYFVVFLCCLNAVSGEIVLSQSMDRMGETQFMALLTNTEVYAMMTTCSFGLGNGLKLYRFRADLDGGCRWGLKIRMTIGNNLHELGYKLYLQLSCVCTYNWNGNPKYGSKWLTPPSKWMVSFQKRPWVHWNPRIFLDSINLLSYRPPSFTSAQNGSLGPTFIFVRFLRGSGGSVMFVLWFEFFPFFPSWPDDSSHLHVLAGHNQVCSYRRNPCTRRSSVRS